MHPPAFTRAQVDHLAQLAALSLTRDEADAMARELGRIVAYIQELSEVDTSDVAPAAINERAAAAWRDDVLAAGLTHDDAVGGAARTTEDGFAVPGFVSAGSTIARPPGAP